MSAWMKRLLVLVLASLFLVACGTDDESQDSGDENQGQTDNGGGESTDPGGSGNGGDPNFAVGSWKGGEFRKGVVGLSSDEIGSEGSTKLRVDVVNPNDKNSLLLGEELSVEIQSGCLSATPARATLNAEASFTTESGSIRRTYEPGEDCAGGGPDELQVSVSPADTEAVKKATAEIRINKQLSFAVGNGLENDFSENKILARQETIGTYGSTILEVTAVDPNNGNEVIQGENLKFSFTSDCLKNDNSELVNGPNPFKTENGDVQKVYKLKDCNRETDKVKVKVSAPDYPGLDGKKATVNLDLQKSSTITVGVPDPKTLGVAGESFESESAPQSEIQFQVLNKKGDSITGEEVQFELIAEDIASDGNGRPVLVNEDKNDITDEDGYATARVKAGFADSVVRVKASLAGESSIANTSQPLAVNTSIPHQQGISLSLTDAPGFKPHAWNHDGTEVPVTVRAVDQLGHPVDGAIVSFATSAGAIESDCVLENGVCTVTWTSQDPRSSDGRIAVTARTVGEETYTDGNGNRRFDDGEEFVEHGEPFLDSNWNGSHEIDETLFDTNGNEVRDDGIDNTYIGLACPLGESYCERETKPVWDDLTGFWLASDTLGVTVEKDGKKRYCATVWSKLGNDNAKPTDGILNTAPPPTGTSISFEVVSGDFEIESSKTKFEVSDRSTTKRFVEECVKVVASNGATSDGTLRVTTEYEDSQSEDDSLTLTP